MGSLEETSPNSDLLERTVELALEEVLFESEARCDGGSSAYAFVRGGQPQPGTVIEFSSQAKKPVSTRPAGEVLGWLPAATESNHAVGSESSSHPGVA
jgi:hypothetical protein